MNKMRVSVIIPTRNRCELLKVMLESVKNQNFSDDDYEIIVVDNASTDNTKDVVEECNHNGGKTVLYVREEHAGLHNARHTGARIAKGGVLVFCDDDIVASKGWLEAVSQSFSDKDVALVGGKILPLYQGKPPPWLESLWMRTRHGRALGYLSLLDLGDEPKEIPPTCVYGCNFSIRKDVLYECGGFHPDSMPDDLIRFRGDGETALARAVRQKGYKVLYHPAALVYHRVTQDRMVPEYFYKRAFAQGISDSYTDIRKGEANKPCRNITRHLGPISWFVRWRFKVGLRFVYSLRKNYLKGYVFHHAEVARDPDLLTWVQKPSYFEGSIE